MKSKSITILEKTHRTKLAFLPTPIVEAKKLSAFLKGPEIYIKRDDQTGLGFGGNKTRKLEYFIADAINKGCDTVITAGASQSNHCRQTAAATASAGLNCHLCLGGEPDPSPNGNLLLDMLLGAHIHWGGKYRKGEEIPLVKDKLIRDGHKPYIIPYGGSNALGALGFVSAVKELKEQLAEMQTNIDYIIIASSSGGTHAGLQVGLSLFDVEAKLIGIEIDKGEAGEGPYDEALASLANEVSQKLSMDISFLPKDFLLKKDYLGEGYGIVGDLEREAISVTARLEGVFLDPVYTGRAMGGLFDLVRKKEFTKKDKVLFWHTGGGTSIFHYATELLKNK